MRLKAMDLAIELVGAVALVFITLVGAVLAVAFAMRNHPENRERGAKCK